LRGGPVPPAPARIAARQRTFLNVDSALLDLVEALGLMPSSFVLQEWEMGTQMPQIERRCRRFGRDVLGIDEDIQVAACALS